jgi:hypothetical protein
MEYLGCKQGVCPICGVMSVLYRKSDDTFKCRPCLLVESAKPASAQLELFEEWR